MRYEDKGKNFYISISQTTVNKIIEICKKSCSLETGGIIIGHYSANHKGAYITEATKQTEDSSSGSFWFKRGIKGLKDLLIEYWTKNQYYLGEWHFHPGNSPHPSTVDINQMNSISMNKKFNCPEPILIIVGQDQKNYIISIQLFINGKMIKLYHVNEE